MDEKQVLEVEFRQVRPASRVHCSWSLQLWCRHLRLLI